MRVRAAVLVAAAAAGLSLCGCGGGTPGFGNMAPELRVPSATSRALSRQPAARSLWDVERLRRAPLNAQTVADRQERAAETRLAVREVTFDAEVTPGRVEKLFGLFALPAPKAGDGAGTRLPAVVLVHDLAETSSEENARAWAARGYAVLALDLPGKGPGREKSRSAGPEMTEEALFKVAGGAQNSYLFSAVTAVLRAVSFLREQKEVDPRKIALLGEAWGGVIAALAGSVDDRVSAVVAVHAAGGFQRSSPALAKLKALEARERDLWGRSFDVVSYSRSEQPPALFVGATNDRRWAAESLVDTARRYNGPHALALAPGKDHELDAPARAAIIEWLGRASRGTAQSPAPAVTVANGQWLARTSGRQPVKSVSFFYGSGSGDWSQREWKEVPATRAGDRQWSAAAPEGGENVPLLVRVHEVSGAALTLEVTPQPDKRATRGKAPAGG